MSTSYYRLVEPFTSIRLREEPGHDRATFWESGANCGTLTVSRGVGARLALLFANREDDHACPMRTHWGGRDQGSVVTVNDTSLADDVTLISDYGQVLTVAEVKARTGQRRKDGWPTELLGYEAQL